MEKVARAAVNSSGQIHYKTSKMIDFEGKPQHALQFLDGQRIKNEARKQHVLDFKKKCPTTNYKTDFISPRASGEVEFFKKPQFPVRGVNFDKNMMSAYDETNAKLMEEKRRSRTMAQSLDTENAKKFLLSAEFK